MKIPFLSFSKRNALIRKEVLQKFETFFDSEYYVLGKNTQAFELAYGKFNRTKYCIGVSNGLDALRLSLNALGIGEGDEVIVPANTYIASVLAITHVGAKPVFVEPRIETYNINPTLIEASITERTKAIMPVHLYGQACEMKGIMDIAKKHNLYVVEDNAQAHGAKFGAQLTGSFGDINATSFYPTKNLGALGEAGAITTNNEELYNTVLALRNYGSFKRYVNPIIGYNNRIDEFEAAFLNISLKYLGVWNAARQEVADFYQTQLASIGDIILPKLAKGATSMNHLFVIRTNYREALQNYLKERGIDTLIHYPIPPHLQKCYAHLGLEKGTFPIAEKLANTCLSLPNYFGIDKECMVYITDEIKTFFEVNV